MKSYEDLLEENERLRKEVSSQSNKIRLQIERDKRWRVMLQHLYDIQGLKVPKLDEEN